MLSGPLAHEGPPVGPHDLWSAWNVHPLVIAGLVLAGLAYHRGRPRSPRSTSSARWRAASFTAALLAIALALVSPLDALSAQLASAHMVQHVLLSLVAPPLLVLAAPAHRLLRGVPRPARRRLLRWQRRVGVTPQRVRALRSTTAAWLLAVAALWFWHGSVPYQAALDDELVHAVEHTAFLGTGLLFWWSVVSLARGGSAGGYGVLMLFAMATQSGLLAALLTFARRPWYEGYLGTTRRWGLDPLTDQQLAGVIMWVPAGGIYLGAALALVVVWLQHSETETGSFAGAAVRRSPPIAAVPPAAVLPGGTAGRPRSGQEPS